MEDNPRCECRRSFLADVDLMKLLVCALFTIGMLGAVTVGIIKALKGPYEPKQVTAEQVQDE